MHTRRDFVRGAGGSALALIIAPDALAQGLTSARRAPLISGRRFTGGVLAGDPTPNGITLLTTIADLTRAGSVRLEVARDPGFRHVVASQLIGTSGATDGSVKARVGRLKPHEQYFYRFETKDRHSDVGRFRTALPADSRAPVRFAFFSCQDYTHGFYNAHALLARDDVDFVVNLGDYIYDESYHSMKDGTGVRDDKIGRAYKAHTSTESVIRAALTLEDYRAKYDLYRTDANLRKVHSLFPMVTLWDDHEVQNNYAGKERDGGLPPAEEYSTKRRAAAYRAFFEKMPHFPRGSSQIYRTLKFGRTVDLIVMDQRQYRANQPCNDAVVPPCSDYDRPRDFLGRTQMGFVKNALSSSGAAWKVLANEVTMMPTKVGAETFFGYDSWEGYPREREELLGHIKAKGIKDVVFVTGDIHTFIAGDVRTNLGKGDTVALEFVGGSITSQGLGETDLDLGGGNKLPGNDRNPKTSPAVIDTLRAINPWVDTADFDHHGYGLVTASQSEFDVTLRRMATIKQRSTKALPDAAMRYQVKRGQTSIKGVHGPSS